MKCLHARKTRAWRHSLNFRIWLIERVAWLCGPLLEQADEKSLQFGIISTVTWKLSGFVLVSCTTIKLHLCSSPPRDKFFLMQEVRKWFSFRLLRVLYFRKGSSFPEVLCVCPSSPACCFELRWLPGNSDAAAVSRQLPWHYDKLHERHHKVCTSANYVRIFA